MTTDYAELKLTNSGSPQVPYMWIYNTFTLWAGDTHRESSVREARTGLRNQSKLEETGSIKM